jgi:dTDP-4-dehydrorhamnose reductase
MRVSRDGVTALMAALRAERVDARLVYVSTNAVFSGRRGPNREDDPPDPENRFDAYRFYGLARRAGEVAVLEGWADALVARTANVDGRDAWGEINPRLRSLIDPLRAGQPLPRYVDRWLSPTLVDAVAAGLVEVARADFALPRGRVLHLAGREPITDFAYAQRLARHLGADPALVREDHYLPEGAPGRYDISLETAFTQSCVRTPLLDVDEMLERMGIGKPSPPPES